MKKYLFLSAEDRRPVEESGYRYKKSKPVTAVKTKRDEDGFFIPWAIFRPLGEKGLFCELFGASPVRRAADLRMNRDLLLKEAYEHEVELLMCRIRMSEFQMQQAFCKEEQALELYQRSKLQNISERFCWMQSLGNTTVSSSTRRSAFSLPRQSLAGSMTKAPKI